VIAKDGVGPAAETLDGDGSTFDLCLVKLRTDERGNVTLARTVSTVETTGSEVTVGEQLTEDDVSAGETFVIGVISATQDGADALFVYMDVGATVLG
jgi:hypothetical protein